MAKIRVAVLCGGTSPEREVSLRSGEMVRRNLDPERYEADLLDLRTMLPAGTRPLDDLRNYDVVFLALHGEHGEDGTIQGACELFDVPYTGSGVLASALAMDKTRTKRIYRQAGIPTADEVAVDLLQQRDIGPEAIRLMAEGTLGYPFVLKADYQGSTFGVFVVRTAAEFAEAFSRARELSHQILMERFVAGTEVSCGVLGGATPAALPVVEIIPASGFFDYEAKYTPGGSEEIVPARIDAELTARVQALAVAAHLALGCWGLSRTDMIVTRAREIAVLETNTIPGLTEGSLLPKEARAAGIMMPELLDRLIGFALDRHALRHRTSSVLP